MNNVVTWIDVIWIGGAAIVFAIVMIAVLWFLAILAGSYRDD